MAEFEIEARVKPVIADRDKRQVQDELDELGTGAGLGGVSDRGGVGSDLDDVTQKLDEIVNAIGQINDTLLAFTGARASTGLFAGGDGDDGSRGIIERLGEAGRRGLGLDVGRAPDVRGFSQGATDPATMQMFTRGFGAELERMNKLGEKTIDVLQDISSNTRNLLATSLAGGGGGGLISGAKNIVSAIGLASVVSTVLSAVSLSALATASAVAGTVLLAKATIDELRETTPAERSRDQRTPAMGAGPRGPEERVAGDPISSAPENLGGPANARIRLSSREFQAFNDADFDPVEPDDVAEGIQKGVENAGNFLQDLGGNQVLEFAEDTLNVEVDLNGLDTEVSQAVENELSKKTKQWKERNNIKRRGF